MTSSKKQTNDELRLLEDLQPQLLGQVLLRYCAIYRLSQEELTQMLGIDDNKLIKLLAQKKPENNSQFNSQVAQTAIATGANIKQLLEILNKTNTVGEEIVTEGEVIVVKPTHSWKAGIGELLVNGSYYPDKTMRLHICDLWDSLEVALIKKHCDRFGIVLSLQPPFGKKE